MPDHPPKTGPYGSVGDLPSVAELLKQIAAMKVLTRVVSRQQRPALIALEEQLRALVDVVDGFYDLLGPRNWVFHDDLNTQFAKSLLSLPADAAERTLIDSYRDINNLRFLVRRLDRFPELRIRRPLIERAAADFHAGRYYSTVQLLLSVMDGFVNDIEPAKRRGLHTRTAAEMVAWDSVVGHHMGLARAHQTFMKTFSKPSTEDVRELHRNGIVHGELINYDNDLVASKAWNRLFAVADWATSRRKAKAKANPEGHRSWRQILSSVERNRGVKQALDAWRPSSIAADDKDFATDDVVVRSRKYLDAWKAQNFGRMAALLSPLTSEKTHAKTAGTVRLAMVAKRLTNFDVERVHHTAAAVATVDITLCVDDMEDHGAMRWIRSSPAGMIVAPNEAGSWMLMTWTDAGMLQERRKRTGTAKRHASDSGSPSKTGEVTSSESAGKD